MKDRSEVLLKAAYDILKKCHESNYVLNAMEVMAYYDAAECDGHCLYEDIASYLGIEEE